MMSADRRPRHRGLRSLLALLGVLALGVPAGAVAGGPVVAALPDGVPAPASVAAPAAGDPLVTAGSTVPLFQTGQILPGVHVGSVDLSGLDEAAARQALTAGFAFIGQGQVVLNADGASTTISYAAINRRLDIDTMIDEAFNVGRTGDAMARIVALVYTMGTGSDLTPVIIFDEGALSQRVAEAANALKQTLRECKGRPDGDRLHDGGLAGRPPI